MRLLPKAHFRAGHHTLPGSHSPVGVAFPVGDDLYLVGEFPATGQAMLTLLPFGLDTTGKHLNSSTRRNIIPDSLAVAVATGLGRTRVEKQGKNCQEKGRERFVHRVSVFEGFNFRGNRAFRNSNQSFTALIEHFEKFDIKHKSLIRPDFRWHTPFSIGKMRGYCEAVFCPRLHQGNALTPAGNDLV